MDETIYLELFDESAEYLKADLKEKGLECAVGAIKNSVFLKLFRRSWTNNTVDPLNAGARIFFSLWINDDSLEEKKLFYNIHALKLREWPGYKIQGRKFASKFRDEFAKYENVWPNVSTSFGPQTLMEGWEEIDPTHFRHNILTLAYEFLEIDWLVDKTLKEFIA
jgi:hypothetical protein